MTIHRVRHGKHDRLETGTNTNPDSQGPVQNKISTVQKSLIAMGFVGLQATAKFVGYRASYFVVNRDFCISDYFPSIIKTIFDANTNPVVQGRNWIASCIVSVDNHRMAHLMVNSGVLGSISEEWFLRGFIQERVIRTIQNKFISVFYPEKPEAIDSKWSKLTRIALSTAIFALIHYQSAVPLEAQNHPNYINNASIRAQVDDYFFQHKLVKDALIINSIFSGLVYGLVQEVTGNTWHAVALHSVSNIGAIIFQEMLQK